MQFVASLITFKKDTRAKSNQSWLLTEKRDCVIAQWESAVANWTRYWCMHSNAFTLLLASDYAEIGGGSGVVWGDAGPSFWISTKLRSIFVCLTFWKKKILNLIYLRKVRASYHSYSLHSPILIIFLRIPQNIIQIYIYIILQNVI